jgi:hypothetical protein
MILFKSINFKIDSPATYPCSPLKKKNKSGAGRCECEWAGWGKGDRNIYNKILLVRIAP